MKKLIFSILTICLSILFIPNELKAAPDSLRTQNTSQAGEAQILIRRLEEIKAIDKSTLSRSDKKKLRKEVQSIDGKLQAMNGGGVYISVGALIIIVILLIILL